MYILSHFDLSVRLFPLGAKASTSSISFFHLTWQHWSHPGESRTTQYGQLSGASSPLPSCICQFTAAKLLQDNSTRPMHHGDNSWQTAGGTARWVGERAGVQCAERRQLELSIFTYPQLLLLLPWAIWWWHQCLGHLWVAVGRQQRLGTSLFNFPCYCHCLHGLFTGADSVWTV